MKLPRLFPGKVRLPRLTVDLNLPAHRWKLLGAVTLLLLIAGGMVVGGVQGYHYTESVEFCGSTCHSMYPQRERHAASDHAKVECTECHVGPGAEAFIQSKIAGTRQLIHTLTDNVSRPILSPVHNLRPARETCEGCHSPTSFTDNIIKVVKHYENDKRNTPTETTLILKMGGTNSLTNESRGIHWHVSSAVYYVALDEQRQIMAWIGVEQPDGTLKEYFARDLIGMGQTAFVEEARAKGEVRKLDCIDCHNRAAHYIPYPEQMVDAALANGLISADLPFIRKNAVAILDTPYETEESALSAIDELRAEYRDAPEAQVTQALETLKDLYATTNFPDMKLDWKTNPNNERHTPTAGCFRCHDGNHVLADASAGSGAEQVISVKCNLCHTVPIIGSGPGPIVDAPVVIGSIPASHDDFRWTIEHRNVNDAGKQACYDCHGQTFCNNAACHNLSHPEDMAFKHPAIIKEKGGQEVCYTCHQNVTCTRCHPSGIGIVTKP